MRITVERIEQGGTCPKCGRAAAALYSLAGPGFAGTKMCSRCVLDGRESLEEKPVREPIHGEERIKACEICHKEFEACSDERCPSSEYCIECQMPRKEVDLCAWEE